VIAHELDHVDPQQLRQALIDARAEVAAMDEQLQQREREVAFKQAVIDKLTHENAVLKRLKFAASSEGYNAEQKSLLEETLDADQAAVAAEIEALQPSTPTGDKRQPRREKLPADLPRREIHHEPEDTTCGCGQPMRRIGEDVYASGQPLLTKGAEVSPRGLAASDAATVHRCGWPAAVAAARARRGCRCRDRVR
jgi:hypothetical protein